MSEEEKFQVVSRLECVNQREAKSSSICFEKENDDEDEKDVHLKAVTNE